MTKYLINYHFIDQSKIVEVRNPAYDNRSYVSQNSVFERVENRKILYACMGSFLFEQEASFINELSQMLCKLGFNLEILKHPKFDTPGLIKQKNTVIPYSNHSSADLLQAHLSKYELILTAGSSIALDCVNYDLEVVCIFIETIPIHYWRSVKRYTDHVEHFSDFLKENNVKVFMEFDSFAKELQIPKNISSEANKALNVDFKGHASIYEQLLKTISDIMT